MKELVPETIVKSHGPSVAWTDGACVYIRQDAMSSRKALRTLLRHERAHIMLLHKMRGRKFRPTSWRKWNVACDMEIAMHIYDQRDEEAIVAPRSPLANGINREYCEKIAPGVSLYAEDYYSLVPDDAECMDDIDGIDGIEPHDGDQDNQQEIEVADVIRSIRSALDAASDAEERQDALEKAQRQVHKNLMPRPSLPGFLDQHLARHAMARRRTYHKPTRRVAGDIIMRGIKRKPANPRVTVYVDRSGSFSSPKTEHTLRIIGTVLARYRARLRCDVIYFADTLMCRDPMHGDGGTNYTAVLEDINRSLPDVAVVITDDDPAMNVPKPSRPVVVIPIGCQRTKLAGVIGACEVIPE